jgi:tetratricopeptide (TPR) repeat protein
MLPLSKTARLAARLRRSVLLAAALLASSCTRSAGSGSGERDAEPERLERAGRWLEAAELHRIEGLRLAAERSDAHIRQAMADFVMGDRLEEVEKLAEEVLKRDPKRHEVLFYLGDSQRVMRRYPAARATLERLLLLEPAHQKGLLGLGHVLLRLGEPEQALVPLQALLQHEPEAGLREQAELEAARALRRLERPREAADLLTALLERSPQDPVALSEASQTFFILGKPELARGLREAHGFLSARGHQLASDDESKVYQTGVKEGAEARQALQAADRREFLEALGKLEPLVAAAPGDSLLASALGKLWMRLGRRQEALAVIRAALERPSSGEAELHRVRGETLLALGRLEEARASFRKGSDLLAGSAALPQEQALGQPIETHLLAAQCELRPGGDLRIAGECYRRVLALAPRDPRALAGQARVALESGKPGEALAIVKEAGDLVAGSPDLRRWGAVARGLQGDLRFAAREIMELIRRSPGDLSNFQAFERVFGSRAAEAEVSQVLAMKRALEARLAAEEELLRSVGEKPFRESGPAYLAAGKSLLEKGSREMALDFLFLAADLLPADTESLERAAGALTAPGQTFLRLSLLRRILERSPAPAAALRGLVQLYLDLDLRLGEARSLAQRLDSIQPGEESRRLLTAASERLRSRG